MHTSSTNGEHWPVSAVIKILLDNLIKTVMRHLWRWLKPENFQRYSEIMFHGDWHKLW